MISKSSRGGVRGTVFPNLKYLLCVGAGVWLLSERAHLICSLNGRGFLINSKIVDSPLYSFRGSGV